MKLFFEIIGILFCLFLICFCVEQRLLLTRKKTIYLENLPADFDGYHVLQISDIHHKKMGKQNRRIVKKAQQLKPDIIVITGDLVSRDEKNFDDTAIFLHHLRQIAPVYLCLGNHELDLPPGTYHKLLQIIRKSGCHLLDNASVTIRKNKMLRLVGASLCHSVYRDENHGFRNLEKYTLEKLTKEIHPKHYCTILLAHNPFFLDIYAAWGADLVLSGHIHGGIVRLPFVGGLLSPERKFFPKYSKGLYQQTQTQMYVSGGIGKLRLLNPSEINFFTLECTPSHKEEKNENECFTIE